MPSCDTKDNCQNLDKENILKHIMSEVLGYLPVYTFKIFQQLSTSPNKTKIGYGTKMYCLMSQTDPWYLNHYCSPM